MMAYGIMIDFEPTPFLDKCVVRSCVFPGRVFSFHDRAPGGDGFRFTESLCGFHFVVGAIPFSMEYEDSDALLAIPKHRHASFYKDNYAVYGKLLNPMGRRARIGMYCAQIAGRGKSGPKRGTLKSR